MWSASILNTTYGPGYLSVKVIFNDSEVHGEKGTLTEDIDITGAEDINVLHIKVASRINTLNATSALNKNLPPNGDFVPVIPDISDDEKLRISANKIEKIQRYKELGIIPQTPKEATDAVLADAIADAQDAFDPTKL